MGTLGFDIAHLLSGGMLVLSLLLLYQSRLIAVINVFALQAIMLALSVAWQAYLQGAPHLLVTAAIALVVKGLIIPFALQRIVRRLDIHREVENVIGGGPTMLTGLALIALSILLLQPSEGSVLTREDLAFALAVILLGLLMMITRRNAVTQIVGFMSHRERPDPGGDRVARHAAGGGDFGRVLDPDRVRRVRHLHIPHS